VKLKKKQGQSYIKLKVVCFSNSPGKSQFHKTIFVLKFVIVYFCQREIVTKSFIPKVSVSFIIIPVIIITIIPVSFVFLYLVSQ